MKKIKHITFITLALTATAVLADDAAKNGDTEEALAMKLQNPVASLISVCRFRIIGILASALPMPWSIRSMCSPLFRSQSVLIGVLLRALFCLFFMSSRPWRAVVMSAA